MPFEIQMRKFYHFFFRLMIDKGPFTNDVTHFLRFLTPFLPLVTHFTKLAYELMSPFGRPLPPPKVGDVLCEWALVVLVLPICMYTFPILRPISNLQVVKYRGSVLY